MGRSFRVEVRDIQILFVSSETDTLTVHGKTFFSLEDHFAFLGNDVCMSLLQPPGKKI